MASSENDSGKRIPKIETPALTPALIDFQNISVLRGDKLALNNPDLADFPERTCGDTRAQRMREIYANQNNYA